MRLAYLRFAPILLACSVLTAQQVPGSSVSDGAPAPAASQPQPAGTVAAVPPATSEGQGKPDDPISRGEAKAAGHVDKDRKKEEAKAQKEAEKQKKQQEAEAKLLKLEDNEIAISVFDDQGNPVKIPPCAKKDKSCQEKRKELLKQKRVELNVQNGTLTVDGMIGRARLNYEIPSFLYLYVSVPGYGTIVASPVHFPYSTELKDALDGPTLTITTPDDHVVQLSSEKPLSGKAKRSIFFAVDHDFQQPGRYPSIGYGTVNKAPYVWPGALPMSDEQKRHLANAPALPKGMEVQAAAVPCQQVAAGTTTRPVKVNGTLVTPPPCKAGQVASTPGAFSTTTSERPPDGSGAASTGIAEDHSR
ncbi:hypothetical protein [Terriglobus aquaticus]|uniref:DUF4384 domain-containing protein n=1 Tax=Terriglobus aquaticus TaxID=940139 RepID=A0ABW9KKL7_9BACT|nr:hypothetical protein [Terriglobus aquaticus]